MNAGAVAVHREGHAVPQDLAEDAEIPGGIFLLAERRPEDLAGGVVDCADQARVALLGAEPAVPAGVDLHEHAFGGTALTAHAVVARAGNPRGAQRPYDPPPFILKPPGPASASTSAATSRRGTRRDHAGEQSSG